MVEFTQLRVAFVVLWNLDFLCFHAPLLLLSLLPALVLELLLMRTIMVPRKQPSQALATPYYHSLYLSYSSSNYCSTYYFCFCSCCCSCSSLVYSCPFHFKLAHCFPLYPPL